MRRPGTLPMPIRHSRFAATVKAPVELHYWPDRRQAFSVVLKAQDFDNLFGISSDFTVDHIASVYHLTPREAQQVYDQAVALRDREKSK